MGKKIQYKGTSDIVRLEKGENWSGRLADPLAANVEWNWDNNHIIDTDEAGLSDEAVELLLEDTDRFRDVTDLKRIPANEASKMWRGVRESTPQGEVGGDVSTTGEQGSDAGDTGTTTGGSTAAGGSTRGGRGGSTRTT